MESKKMMTVAALAMVFMILLSANMDTVDAQVIDCWDSCNTACVGLPPRQYQRCDGKCVIKCGPDYYRHENPIYRNLKDGKIDGNLG